MFDAAQALQIYRTWEDLYVFSRDASVADGGIREADFEKWLRKCVTQSVVAVHIMTFESYNKLFLQDRDQIRRIMV